MSAGSPTVRLLLLAQSIPLYLLSSSFQLPLPVCLSALCPSVSVCLLSLPSSVFLPSSWFLPSSSSSSFFSFFSSQHCRVYSRRNWADADFPPHTPERENKSLRCCWSIKAICTYFFILIVHPKSFYCTPHHCCKKNNICFSVSDIH